MARRLRKKPSRSRARKVRPRRAIPTISAWTAALASSAYHSLDAEEKRRSRRSAAAKRGWRLRKYKAEHGPPKAFVVVNVATVFGSPKAAVDFARANLIPPWEWADEVAEEFDVDIHDLYEAYYDTDPANQAE